MSRTRFRGVDAVFFFLLFIKQRSRSIGFLSVKHSRYRHGKTKRSCRRFSRSDVYENRYRRTRCKKKQQIYRNVVRRELRVIRNKYTAAEHTLYAMLVIMRYYM